MNANRPADTFMVLPGMKPTYTDDPKHPGETRLQGCAWLPNRARNLLVSAIGEFVGTFLFLFFAFSATQIANTQSSSPDAPPNLATLLYISCAFGFSLIVNVWMFFRISGGLFNPAVTIALALVGVVGWVKAVILIFAQVLAGIAAAGVVSSLLPGPLAVRTRLHPSTSVVRGLFIETFLTAELIFCIFMLAAEKSRSTFLAPVTIGLSLLIAELAGVWFTGGSLNPARSFGPDVVLRTFDGYHWIYWIGPLLGAILAVLFYRLMKVLDYETANPNADSDGRDYIVDPRLGSNTSSPLSAEESRRRRRDTDGTNESELLPPANVVSNTTFRKQASGSSHGKTTRAETGPYSVPSPPLPVYRLGGDAHYSNTAVDHPDERPRAQHRPRSSRSSCYEHERSYNSGPSIESGSGSSADSSQSTS